MSQPGSAAYGRFPCGATRALQAAPSSALRAYLAIAEHADRDFRAWPGTARLAELAGLNERTVRRAIEWLENARLLRRTTGGGRGRATLIELRCDFEKPGHPDARVSATQPGQFGPETRANGRRNPGNSGRKPGHSDAHPTAEQSEQTEEGAAVRNLLAEDRIDPATADELAKRPGTTPQLVRAARALVHERGVRVRNPAGLLVKLLREPTPELHERAAAERRRNAERERDRLRAARSAADRTLVGQISAEGWAKLIPDACARIVRATGSELAGAGAERKFKRARGNACLLPPAELSALADAERARREADTPTNNPGGGILCAPT